MWGISRGLFLIVIRHLDEKRVIIFKNATAASQNALKNDNESNACKNSIKLELFHLTSGQLWSRSGRIVNHLIKKKTKIR